MDPVVGAYLAYLAVSVALTVWVSRVLTRHGERFLRDVFPEDHDLARSVNQLLVVGFYLLSFGYVALTMRIGGDVDDMRGIVEELAARLGGVSLGLGALHLANLLVLSRLRRRRVSVPAAAAGAVAPGPYSAVRPAPTAPVVPTAPVPPAPAPAAPVGPPTPGARPQ